MYEDETEAIRRADIAATQEIRDAFASYFAGNTRAAVPVVRGASGVELQYVSKAIAYAIDDGKPFAALSNLLQCTGDFEVLRDQLRKALTEDYVNQNAADVAQERAAWEAPTVHPWMMKEAA